VIVIAGDSQRRTARLGNVDDPLDRVCVAGCVADRARRRSGLGEQRGRRTLRQSRDVTCRRCRCDDVQRLGISLPDRIEADPRTEREAR
jgi:hypothetical protein